VGGTDDPELADNGERSDINIAGQVVKPDEDIHVEVSMVTPQYFDTLGVPLLAGRSFTDQDLPGKAKVAIVNASFARRYLGDAKSTVGHMIGQGPAPAYPSDTEIVGVVGDARHRDMRTEATPTVYVPYFQTEGRSGYMQLYVRTWQAPEAAELDLRRAVQQVDSKLVIDTMRTMDEQIADNISNDRLVAMLALSFGILATLLAAVGLYGVLAYVTEQRTREIGIRMALGARRGAVVRLVLSDVLWLAGISVVITLPVAIMLSRLLRSQLYNVSPADPVVMASGVFLIALVVTLAALLPARRAASVNPMRALRTE
jgi:putative ABC transport system permease protein